MNNKGFTLIELLGVILLLSIISLIVVPTVNNIIEESKKEAIKGSALNIARSVEEQCYLEKMKKKDITKSYIIIDGKISSNLALKKLPDKGYITLNEDCEVAISVTDNKYCIKMENEKTTISKNVHNCVNDHSIIPDTKESCFIFDSKTRTITGYNYDDKSCPMDISIPATINNVPVEHIGDFAFLSEEYDFKMASGYKNENISNDLLQNLETKGFEVTQIIPIIKINNDIVKYCYKSEKNDTYEEKPIDYEVTSFDEFYNCNFDSFSDAAGKEYHNNVDYKYSGGKIERVDFSKATNLISIGIGSFFNNKINSINFDSLPNLKDIGINAFSNNNIVGILDLFGLTGITNIKSYTFQNNNISNIILPNSLNIIGEYAFFNNSLSSINLPNSIKIISDNAFSKNNITSLVVPEKTEYLSGFGENFISELYIPNNVKTIGVGAFSGNLIHNLTIPASVETIKSEAFYNNGMTSLVLNDGLVNIKDYSFSTNLLTNLIIPKTVKYLSGFDNNNIGSLAIPNSTVEIGNKAFYMNQKLDTVIMGNNVEKVGNYAFYTSRLRKITWGNSLKSIGDYAFYRCQWSSLSLPEGVETIGSHSFWNNYWLTTLVIPNSVRTIGEGAFQWQSLKDVTIGSGIQSISNDCFITNYTTNDGEKRSMTIRINKNSTDSVAKNAPWGQILTTIIWNDKTQKYDKRVLVP